jgi:hypothetical protein
MIDPLQAFLQANALKTPLFPATSRYYSIGSATLQTAEGKSVIYLKRRFLPQPGDLALLQEHSVSAGDRIDNLAQQYLGDAEQYWRLCDGNGAMNPAQLTETVGRRLRITLPEGVPGPTHG